MGDILINKLLKGRVLTVINIKSFIGPVWKTYWVQKCC